MALLAAPWVFYRAIRGPQHSISTSDRRISVLLARSTLRTSAELCRDASLLLHAAEGLYFSKRAPRPSITLSVRYHGVRAERDDGFKESTSPSLSSLPGWSTSPTCIAYSNASPRALLLDQVLAYRLLDLLRSYGPHADDLSPPSQFSDITGQHHRLRADFSSRRRLCALHDEEARVAQQRREVDRA